MDPAAPQEERWPPCVPPGCSWAQLSVLLNPGRGSWDLGQGEAWQVPPPLWVWSPEEELPLAHLPTKNHWFWLGP